MAKVKLQKHLEKDMLSIEPSVKNNKYTFILIFIDDLFILQFL